MVMLSTFMERFQETIGRFLMLIFIFLPLFLLFFFILTLVRYNRAKYLSGEVRRKRRFWFLFVSIAGGIAFLIWLAIVIFFFITVSY